VPVKVDYEDVYDIMSFFRGADAEGKEGEDKLAEQIARQGLEWSHEYWRKEDMVAYISRLYLEVHLLLLSVSSTFVSTCVLTRLNPFPFAVRPTGLAQPTPDGL
jgi:hypothetical protein